MFQPHSSQKAKPWVTRLVFVVVIGCGVATDAAQRTLGWLEWAWLEPGNIKLKTKLDTGARTSSIDARDIEEFERDGERWVRFRIPLSERPDDTDQADDLLLERPVVRETRIKDHGRPSQARYVVELDFCIGGFEIGAAVTLADRRRFNYPLLLGRSALQGLAVVDPAAKFSAGRSCRRPPPRPQS